LFIIAQQNANPQTWTPLPPDQDGELSAGKFEGDINGNVHGYASKRSYNGQQIYDYNGADSAATGPGTVWPLGIVPYYISGTFTAQIQQYIQTAMQKIMNITGPNCVQFRPKTASDTNWIDIKSEDTGCHSYLGKQSKPGAQELNLQPNGCFPPQVTRSVRANLFYFYQIDFFLVALPWIWESYARTDARFGFLP